MADRDASTAQRELADALYRSPRVASRRASVQRIAHSPRVLAQARPHRVQQRQSAVPAQLTRVGGGVGLAGGGLLGGLAAVGLGIANPLALAAMIGVPALLGAVGLHRATGPDKKSWDRNDTAIPDLMHFVWLGGRVPPERQQNMISWVRAARGVQVNLWVDANAERATAGDLESLRRAGIRIRRVRELTERSDRLRELQDRLPTVDDGGVNGGAAGALSDVVRLEVLSGEGGTYMDSDNTPGTHANSFAGMTAPMGVRLGWGELEGDENFSNDAISAAPGNEFIRKYLAKSYENLTPRTVGMIRSQNKEDVKAGVMESTGPHAMRGVPLPVGDEHMRRLKDELVDVPKLSELTALDPAELTEVNIGTFGRNRQGYKETRGAKGRFSPAMTRVFEAMSFGKDMFTRASDNSWLR